ncbi:MAG: hypothetical protein K8T10_15395 [Candidatus Eremiobacteraeota bacterium]|nr:hypothetical protein [Candidatus Eremiobacteraeota bacterium]
MINVIVIIVAMLFISGTLGIGYYFYVRSRSLDRVLNLRLEVIPPRVNRGQDIKVSLMANPARKIKGEVVSGELICKQFNIYSGKMRDWTESAASTHGDILAHFLFSFGSDLVFLPGSDNRYEGVIPIPEDACPTDAQDPQQVHWAVRATVHIEGYNPTVTFKEVNVTAHHPQMLEVLKKDEILPADHVMKKGRKGALRQNVQVVFSGSDEGSGREEISRETSSFGFLELDGDQNGNS